MFKLSEVKKKYIFTKKKIIIIHCLSSSGFALIELCYISEFMNVQKLASWF